MQITFIRHLPTDWNKKSLLQGRKDIPLSPITKTLKNGVKENQERLKEQSPFDLVLTSTLLRTRQTAHIYGYEAQTEDLLDELDFGPYEGRTKEELVKKYKDLWFDNPQKLKLGESIKNLERRILLFLDKYKDFQNILVFGHGSWIRAMKSYNQYGHIGNMNKMTMDNNECITLTVNRL